MEVGKLDKVMLLAKSLLQKIKKRVFPAHSIQKTYEMWASKNYNSEPAVSFVIQVHNNCERVSKFVRKLRKFENSEIIVIDDGSKKKQSLILLQELTGANEFILRSNDLYEVITYDRAIYLSRGKYIALLQDDDDFDDFSWVDDAVKCFERFTDLVFLGGRLGVDMLPFETTPDKMRGEYEMENGYGQRKNSFKYKFIDQGTEIVNFRFTQAVVRAPMWVNRALFIDKIKHIDQSFAPFQWDDAEMCLRAYSVGLKVAWYRTNFKISAAGDGGMRIWNLILHHRQDEVNAKKIYALYKDRFEEFQQIIDNANAEIIIKQVL